MSARKGIVLDANILLRAVFGHRVLHLVETYEDKARFYAPDVCFLDALKYTPLISKQRGFDAELRVSFLHEISRTVEQVDRSLYKHYEPIARERIERRDPDDWPVVAVALLPSPSDLDRGSGFFREWHGDLDDRPSGGLSPRALIGSNPIACSVRSHAPTVIVLTSVASFKSSEWGLPHNEALQPSESSLRRNPIHLGPRRHAHRPHHRRCHHCPPQNLPRLAENSRDRWRPRPLLSQVDPRRARPRRPRHRSGRTEVLRRRQAAEMAPRSARRIHAAHRSPRRRNRNLRRTRLPLPRHLRRRILHRLLRHRQAGRHQLESSPALSQGLQVGRHQLLRQPENPRRMEVRHPASRDQPERQ